ncbi:hypothetical protein LTR62_004888 [Meristemomyces frigidus]|uniref:Peptidase A1 domain-containing protein n=1 Tax=Meristemomyces frigidus TaxID=1508187 RepID=A0AAN7TQ51_9PEZI|nr:hypothetical protein LTR62_004888 [Meristemomyces frigidus]
MAKMMAIPSTLLVLALTSFTTAQRVIKAEIWKPQIPLNSTIYDNSTIYGTNETLSRRSIIAQLTPKPDRSLYWINVTLGTPGQPQSLQLDTGSNVLLVPAVGSSLCSPGLIPCAALGSFDSSKSSTFSNTNQATSETFTDGASVSGNWIYDTVGIGGGSVAGQLAILGTSGSSITEGVLGVGFPASWPTLNHNLAAQNIISSNSYSLWLDQASSASGTILFGGLNLARFLGTLLKVPIIGTTNSDGSTAYNQATVQLTRVATINGLLPTIMTPLTYSENAILDTGTSLTILQQDLATSIINAMGAQYYPSGSTSGNAIVPCSAANNNALSVNFHFSNLLTGPTINVPLSQLVLGILGSLDGTTYCQFGIYSAPASAGYPTILGDTFLRNAYAVYDLDTHHVGLAQAVYDSHVVDRIIEIPAGGIPAGIVVG